MAEKHDTFVETYYPLAVQAGARFGMSAARLARLFSPVCPSGNALPGCIVMLSANK